MLSKQTPDSAGQAINELQKYSDQPFGDLLMKSPAIFLVLNGPDLVIEFVNESFLKSAGRGRDIIGKPFLGVFPELRQQHFPDLLNKVFTSTEPYYGYGEKAIVSKNGANVDSWYNYVFQPIFDNQRKISGIAVTAVDITEQVMARKRIAEAEAKYRLLIDNIQDYGIFMCDLNGIISSWNPGIEAIAGYTASEFMSRSVSILFKEEDRFADAHLKELQEAYRSGSSESFQWLIKRDGTEFYAESITSLIKDFSDQPVGFACIFRDITSQVRSEEALREAQTASDRQWRLYEAVTNSTPDLIYVFDLNYKFTYANKALLNMWGKRREDAVGFGLLHNGYEPWHAEMHEREIDQVAVTRKSVRGEVSFPHATLGKRVYDYILVPVVNENGDVEAVAGTTRDITELKLAEAALKQSGEELEALVIERTKELQRSNQDLQRFAHVASHDLKEPVRKIRTFAARLRDEFSADLPPIAKDYLQKIEKAAERMHFMIDGVLSYSKVNAEDEPLEDIDLNQILANIIADLEIQIQEKNGLVEFNDLPVIRGSKMLIHQLFYNLVNNSLKFSKIGRKPHVIIEASEISREDFPPGIILKGNTFVKLTVKDNGIGFSSKDAERIFETFSRLNPKDQYEGTGLGLALCRNIVSRHGGFIYAEGKPGDGAQFCIIFPA